MGQLPSRERQKLIQDARRGLTGGDSATAGPATEITETSGPTTLSIAGIADGQFLKRVGTTITSAVPPAAAALPGSFARPFAMMGA